jgi:integrase
MRAVSDGSLSKSLLAIIEESFIPRHVELKSLAGRIHYQAILKHIVTPESVDRLFVLNPPVSRRRLTTITDWPYLDHVKICDLNPGHVQQLVTAALARGYSTQTVKHIRNVLGAIISHAKREGMFSGDNPASQVELPPMVRKTSPNITIVQAKSMLRVMDYPEREIALFTMTTGMSISDICTLRWRSVNLSAGTIQIDGLAVPPASILVTRRGGPKNCRTIPISASLVETLIELKDRNESSGPDDFVIATHAGAPVSPSGIRMTTLKQIARKLEMPWLSWQVLKRAHEGLLQELRAYLADELALGARCGMIEPGSPDLRN